jgi:hypothetical protein
MRRRFVEAIFRNLNGKSSLTTSGEPVGIATVSQLTITRADSFGLPPQSATTLDALLCVRMKGLTAFVELESAMRAYRELT